MAAEQPEPLENLKRVREWRVRASMLRPAGGEIIAEGTARKANRPIGLR